MIAFPVKVRDAPAERIESPSLAPLRRPVLRFSPTAWSKLLYLGEQGTAEIGAFGITLATDPLLVTEIRLIRQYCTSDSLTLDDESLVDYFDEQVSLRRRPEQFARIWIRIRSARTTVPSRIDEETCRRCFRRTDWMVFCNLGRHGRASAQLRFHVGPGGILQLPITVDFQFPFAAPAISEWDREYQQHVVMEDSF